MNDYRGLATTTGLNNTSQVTGANSFTIKPAGVSFNRPSTTGYVQPATTFVQPATTTYVQPATNTYVQPATTTYVQPQQRIEFTQQTVQPQQASFAQVQGNQWVEE